MWTFVKRKPLGAAGGLVLAGMLALALLAEGVAPYGYDEADIFSRL